MNPNQLSGDPFAEYLVTIINDELSKQPESIRTDVNERRRIMERVLATYGITKKNNRLLVEQFFYFSVSVGPICQTRTDKKTGITKTAIWHNISVKKKTTLRPSQTRFSYRKVCGTGKRRNRFKQEDTADPFMRRRTRERMKESSLMQEAPPRPPETIPVPETRKENFEQLKLLETKSKDIIPPWYRILEQALVLFAFGGRAEVDTVPYFSQAVVQAIRAHKCPPKLKAEVLSKIQQHQNKLRKLQDRIKSARERKREEWEYDEARWIPFKHELRRICKVPLDPPDQPE